MPQQNPGRKVKSKQQLMVALELRAAGASYSQIGKALSVSKPRAFRIVRKASDELVEHCRETAERVRQLERHRHDRYRLALDSRRSDPRAVDTLIRISERVAKLHGLDAPQRIEASAPNDAPIETETKPNFDKLTVDELLQYDELYRKAHGERRKRTPRPTLWKTRVGHPNSTSHSTSGPPAPDGSLKLVTLLPT